MTTLSTTLIIGAKDNASSVLGGVGNSVERVEGKVRGLGGTLGETSQLNSEWMKSLLGPELGQLAEQADFASQALEAVGQNGEKAGLLLKASLVAGVAVVGFQIGQHFSSAKEAAKELNDELLRTVKINEQFVAIRSDSDSFERFKISLAGDASEQRDALAALADAKLQQLSDAQAQIRKLEDNLFEVEKKRYAARSAAGIEVGKDTEWMFFLADNSELDGRIDSLGQAIEQQKLFAAQAKESSTSIENDLKRIDLSIAKSFQAEAIEAASQQAKKYQELLSGFTGSFAAGMQNESAFVGELKEQLNLLKMGAEAYEKYKLLQREDLSPMAKKQAAAIMDEIDALKEKNRVQEESKRIAEAILADRRPKNELDQFNDLKRELDQLKSGGGGGASDLQAKSSRFLSGRSSSQLTATQQQLTETRRQREIMAQMEQIQLRANNFLATIAANSARESEVFEG